MQANSLDEAAEWLYEQGCTDGLPVVIPTEERVDAMLQGLGLPADHIVAGELPPSEVAATIELIAINAVMAGCVPQYLPVVAAAVAAIGEPEFGLRNVNTTTNPAAVLTIVNGPIRQELNVNCSHGCLGPGWKANAAIGRAVHLVQLNVAGAVPAVVSKSTHGQPGRYTMCFGEFEEKSPWDPLHVERGFPKEQSTVTVIALSGTVNCTDILSRTPEALMTMMSRSMDVVGSSVMSFRFGEPLLILNPVHAALLADHGWTKGDVKHFLYENTWRPLSHISPYYYDLLRQESGRVVGDKVILARTADDFVIVVAGGLGGHHSVFGETYSMSHPVTKPVPSCQKS
ncbi:MAG: hypothetical protein HY684_01415 [Chloroflexi bacterium]|nr:hypothetical protein [Chloroflexota bacterium]